jgi:hypothetical protein
MRAGDRDAAAAFVAAYGPLIRRRVRGKLGPAMRRLFDSMEILSTVSRRLDRYVRSGRVRADSETQFWSLVFRMVDAAMADRLRILRRLRAVEGEDSDFAQALLVRLEAADARDDGPESVVDDALRALDDPADRQALSLWLMGNSLRVVAECLGVSHEAMRHRWGAIRDRIRRRLQEPGR